MRKIYDNGLIVESETMYIIALAVKINALLATACYVIPLALAMSSQYFKYHGDLNIREGFIFLSRMLTFVYSEKHSKGLQNTLL